jgi:uncharacterized protein (TIGR00297 family)
MLDRMILRILISSLFSLGLALSSYNKKSLSFSGAIAALVTGVLTFSSGWHFTWPLLGFYLSSSKLTKMGEDRKKKIDADFKKGGQRDMYQVFQNSAPALIAIIFYLYFYSSVSTPKDLDSSKRPAEVFLLCFYLGFYGAATGDTWSSEIGVLSTRNCRLITQLWRKVPPGTNGGVTVDGIIASAGGGLFEGILLWLIIPESSLLIVGCFGGSFGSFLDSVLGACFQFSGINEDRKIVNHRSSKVKQIAGTGSFLGCCELSNGQVNVVASTATALLSGLLGLWLFS